MATEEEFVVEIPHDVATALASPAELIEFYADHPMTQ